MQNFTSELFSVLSSSDWLPQTPQTRLSTISIWSPLRCESSGLGSIICTSGNRGMESRCSAMASCELTFKLTLMNLQMPGKSAHGQHATVHKLPLSSTTSIIPQVACSVRFGEVFLQTSGSPPFPWRPPFRSSNGRGEHRPDQTTFWKFAAWIAGTAKD